MDTTFVFVFLILALLAGLAVGWVMGARPIAEWKARFAARDGEARELDEKFRRAITELAAASVKAGQHDALAEEIGTIRDERDTLAAQFAAAHERASHRGWLLAPALLLLLQRKWRSFGHRLMGGCPKNLGHSLWASHIDHQGCDSLMDLIFVSSFRFFTGNF